MPRISKAPEIRRQEIIDTAMQLFSEHGYDATSIADIAKAMEVVPGLVYRYFTSKQELFEVAVKQYAAESGSFFLPILHRQDISFAEKFDLMIAKMAEVENHSRYSEFYHKPENQTFHVQLALEMCSFMAPHLEAELTRLGDAEGVKEEHPRQLVDFILYGMLSLWSSPHENEVGFEEHVQIMAAYVKRLLKFS